MKEKSALDGVNPPDWVDVWLAKGQRFLTELPDRLVSLPEKDWWIKGVALFAICFAVIATVSIVRSHFRRVLPQFLCAVVSVAILVVLSYVS